MKRPSLPARAALAIPSWLFGRGVALRNRWYDRTGATARVPVPVVSVGNLALGGTGKTPLVAWLAARLAARGRHPAVVSRGYGGRAGPGPLIVSTGEGPRVDARACGDEPHQLARLLPGTLVVVGADRVEAARAAAAAGAGVILLDDGFQHRRLARDLDVVLLDGRAPFDFGLLPAGRLREPPSALARAGVVVLTRLAERDAATAAIAEVRAAGFAGPVVRSGHKKTGFVDAAGRPCPPPARALAFCGIADPELFRSDLKRAGVEVARFRAYRDHHRYSGAAWAALRAEAEADRLTLVTTDKDLSRLEAAAGASLAGVPLAILRIEAVVWDEAPLMAAIVRTLEERA